MNVYEFGTDYERDRELAREALRDLKAAFPTAMVPLPPPKNWTTTDPETNTRQCALCREWKTLTDYHRVAANPLGRHSQCKPCRTAYRAGYRDAAVVRLTRRDRDGTPLSITPCAIVWSEGDGTDG